LEYYQYINSFLPLPSTPPSGTYAISVFCKNSRTTWKNLVEHFIQLDHQSKTPLTSQALQIAPNECYSGTRPLNLRNFQKEGEDRNFLNLIERCGDEKSRTSNLMNYPSDIPALQVTGGGELGRTPPVQRSRVKRGVARYSSKIDVHRMINRPILLKLLERLNQLFRPRIECAYVFFVEHHARVCIFLGVRGALCLMLPDSLNELFREAGEEVVHTLGAERDRGGRVGDDKPFESLRGALGGILAANIPGGNISIIGT